MGNHKKKEKGWFSKTIELKFLPGEANLQEVFLSVVLPVYNCSESIGLTLESMKSQGYGSLEIIVVDAGSTDRTLEIINSYAALISRIYTVTDLNLGDMINKGISLASGQYITILLPGTFYLSPWTYQLFAEKIFSSDFPDLAYCGSIQREIHRESRTIFLPFDLELMEQGKNPATMPACWFRSDLFQHLNKLKTKYVVRWGFDFFCRIAKEKNLQIVKIDRIFVDFDYGRFSYGKVLRFALETWLIIQEHFGFKKAVIWFLNINHFFLIKTLWNRFKLRLSKR